MLDCYNCKYKRNIPGDAHVSCVNHDPKVKGDAHGIESGWFFYPLNFDPIWGSGCTNFEAKENRNDR